MIDAIRPDKLPLDDPKELSTPHAAEGLEESADVEPSDFALQAIEPPRETARGFTSRYPYGTSRRSTHIF